VLLPDGRVLIGGHAPIATGYAFQSDAGSAAGLSKPEADSSFQIYSPPYLSYGPRPKIQDMSNHTGSNQWLDIDTDGRADKVVLVRNPSMTHLTDGDQRTVELVTKGKSGDVKAFVPGPNVVPPGPYMVFVERSVTVGGATKLVPSVSRPLTVSAAGNTGSTTLASTLDSHNGRTSVRARHHRETATRAHSALGRGVPGRLVSTKPAAAASPARRHENWLGVGLGSVALLGLAGYRRRRRQLGAFRQAS
jgi:hypothetical protein